MQTRKPRPSPLPKRAARATNDPLAQTALDYVYNLVVGRLITPDQAENHGDRGGLLKAMVAREVRRRGPIGLPSQERSRDLVNSLHKLATSPSKRPRSPSGPGQPIARNLRFLANLLELDEIELGLVQLALTCRRETFRVALDYVPCDGGRAPLMIGAAALAVPLDAVERALSPRGRLRSIGIITLQDNGDFDNRLDMDGRLERLLFLRDLDEKQFTDEFLPAAPAPTLAPEDFAHLGAEFVTARKLLAAAVARGMPGVNLLLHGPTGTGKSEFARLLARESGLSLLAAGLEDAQGASPNAQERMYSLLLGNKLLARGHNIMLFDEMEDLFKSGALSAWHGQGRERDQRLMSKQWFNLLLETNRVPTIWISNDVSGVDPAFLRRFSYVIDVPKLTASQRRRVWCKHLGGDEPLPGHEVDLLAQRFDVSPAHIATAVSAARLLSDGPVTRATLESVLTPAQRLMHGHSTPPPVFHAEHYLPELVNTPADLAAIERRVTTWRPGDAPGLSLCLYGPPGTGKSEFVRYLAHRAERPLLVKRASDLISMWVGQTEERIAAAFDEARRDEALLLFDEADSFLQDRRGAHHSWEITEVNEFLQQLEVFPGVVACTTNLMETLDQAALRRFVFKVPFKFLRPEQALLAFRRTLADLGGGDEVPAAVRTEIARVPNLAPGDFSACGRRMRGIEAPPSAEYLLAEVKTEVAVKEKATGRVGF